MSVSSAVGSPVEPRLAATVVLLRPGENGLEVLMVRRARQLAFMADAHVFPGGRVDPADGAGAAALRACAVRELREEAGLVVGADSLVELARWITPSSEPKRYDTYFFVATMPNDGQIARHDAVEAVDHLWATPHALMEQAKAGAVKLAPPTLRTLEDLAAHAAVADVIAWASRRPVVPIMPKLVQLGPTLAIVLPWDPEYRALPGDGDAIAPGHPMARGTSRFVLDQGRWWAKR